MKTIAILGSTGSIGRSTLRIVSEHSGRFSVGALAAGRNWRRLAEQIREFRPRLAAVLDEEVARNLKVALGRGTPTDIVTGEQGYGQAAALSDCELVVSAMVGAAGLRPTLAAIAAGKTLALANKESLVIGGALVTRLAREKSVRILPVDSEHSAIFQCMEAHAADVRRLLLTASGGPFRTRPSAELAGVTPEETLRHPNWTMGAKITVDSATMMNKGLEMIEAKWLFDCDLDRIDVLIHPQSVVHSLVEYRDGAVMAQLAVPDMRIPIAYALAYPERLETPAERLDLSAAPPLEFFPPDEERFPCLALGRQAGRTGGTMPAVLNAANEVAVNAFLERRVGFMEIPRLIAGVMAQHRPAAGSGLDDVLEADAWARRAAAAWIDEAKPGQ
jgi:1-deoxy-D-xylulose-5-phosphate reductoisomerase